MVKPRRMCNLHTPSLLRLTSKCANTVPDVELRRTESAHHTTTTRLTLELR